MGALAAVGFVSMLLGLMLLAHSASVLFRLVRESTRLDSCNQSMLL